MQVTSHACTCTQRCVYTLRVGTDVHACICTFRNRGKKRGVRSTLPKACAEQIP